jgi:hypothetical protein
VVGYPIWWDGVGCDAIACAGPHFCLPSLTSLRRGVAKETLYHIHHLSQRCHMQNSVQEIASLERLPRHRHQHPPPHPKHALASCAYLKYVSLCFSNDFY